MVKDANAALFYESTVQQGCMFQIWIPAQNVHHKPSSASTINPMNKLQMLVVDDDPMVLATLKELLELLGAEVLTAMSGFEAIAICTQEPELNTILLDIRMDGLDGFETAKRLQTKGSKQIIFMSGDEPKHGLLQKSKMNEHTFLRKPIQMHQLKTIVDRLNPNTPQNSDEASL